MKIFFDLFPVLMFFGTFKLYGVFAATAVAIVSTIGQIIYTRVRHGSVSTMLWVNFGIIGVFGGATLLLHDETFIKLKPSILYWLLSSVLLISQLLFKKNLMASLLKDKLTLPDQVWKWVNLSWSLFFLALGAANLFVAFNFSTDAWVNFKLFGTTGLMLVFVIGQGLALSRYLPVEPVK